MEKKYIGLEKKNDRIGKKNVSDWESHVLVQKLEKNFRMEKNRQIFN